MAIQEAKQQHPDMLVTKAVVIRETESPTEELQQKAQVCDWWRCDPSASFWKAPLPCAWIDCWTDILGTRGKHGSQGQMCCLEGQLTFLVLTVNKATAWRPKSYINDFKDLKQQLRNITELRDSKESLRGSKQTWSINEKIKMTTRTRRDHTELQSQRLEKTTKRYKMAKENREAKWPDLTLPVLPLCRYVLFTCDDRSLFCRCSPDPSWWLLRRGGQERILQLCVSCPVLQYATNRTWGHSTPPVYTPDTRTDCVLRSSRPPLLSL